MKDTKRCEHTTDTRYTNARSAEPREKYLSNARDAPDMYPCVDVYPGVVADTIAAQKLSIDYQQNDVFSDKGEQNHRCHRC